MPGYYCRLAKKIAEKYDLAILAAARKIYQAFLEVFELISYANEIGSHLNELLHLRRKSLLPIRAHTPKILMPVDVVTFPLALQPKLYHLGNLRRNLD